MSDLIPSHSRRKFLATSAAASAAAVAASFGVIPAPSASAADQPSGSGASSGPRIRPFRVHFPERGLSDLRRRVVSARLPGKETVADLSQGTKLETVERIARY
ncbi:epoxide hydrolase N-terminal domain-containing protein, partial [Streptomyces sp. NPDC046900]|uniref:epoxide hydrolase N-terminal domain-containing protein n=1 Tax=Streptomyces sp. NPDC046900 TaxID=3155473 RepID=UPI003401EA2E